MAAKTEAPSFTNDIVRSSSKLQIAAGEKAEAEAEAKAKAEAEAEKFRGKRARHCRQNWKFGRLVVENDIIVVNYELAGRSRNRSQRSPTF